MTPRAASPFDQIVDRRGTNAVKWSLDLLDPEAAAAEPLPMWVADTDFAAPPAVLDALRAALDHGVLGYGTDPSESYLRAVTGWQARRFGWELPESWVVPVAGVMTAIKTVVQAFSAPGDSVLVQPPVYAHFLEDVVLNGRQLAPAPLTRTEDGYRFDAPTFEAAIRDDTRIFLLSNPHNPTGNVWTAQELATMGEICARHGVLVVADEIHQDLIMAPARRHVPFASLSQAHARTSITCTAPSKTFNLPGLQTAHVFIADRELREGFIRRYERNLFPLPNVLGMAAAEAAYTHGEVWLEDLLDYLRGNHACFAEAVNGATDRLRVLPADSLYLAWMDCRRLELGDAELERFMLTRARLWLEPGRRFGAEGSGHMRINLGCPRATVEEAADRLLRAVAERG